MKQLTLALLTWTLIIPPHTDSFMRGVTIVLTGLTRAECFNTLRYTYGARCVWGGRDAPVDTFKLWGDAR
jgi:hypothetical protein